METPTILLLALSHLHLAAAQSLASSAAGSGPSWSVSAVTPSGTGINGGVAMCGQGFTYCGYILRDHQNFNEQDIVKAYCAGNRDNCANGKTKSNPIQALYVCLPPESATSSTKIKAKHRRQNGAPPSSGVSPAPAPASTFWTSTGGSGGGSGNGVGGGNSCSSTETPGNRIELLCACGNQCLNPLQDHIGRCDSPCS